MKTLKQDALIKNLNVSASFYERLQQVVFKLHEVGDKDGLETILILLSSLDKLAEDQGLIEDLDVVPLQ
jgi:hypothetical protein